MAEETELTPEERQVIEDITENIKTTCVNNKYTQICTRIQTDNGLAYVVNRCIKMMANDGIKLGSALTSLESELEGMN